ncbi:MAG: metallophosphoesterase [Candidatus Thorarchaeota archaeon]
MIIAVSDLHLGDPVSNRTGVLSFIEDFLTQKSDEISDLILLGDILDLWRRNSSAVILDYLDVLNNVCALGFNVHYIVGNHDFTMIDYGPSGSTVDVPKVHPDNPTKLTVSESLTLSNGGKKFRFIHGHQMSYWYALPFYEAFSRAMCNITEEVKELSNVWTILQRQTEKHSPFIFERIGNLSSEERLKIDGKLAGPLVGHITTVEESLIEDYNLLRNFVEFKDYQTNRVAPIHNEISVLFKKIEAFPKIESLEGLRKITKDSHYEELAGAFLNAWIGVFRWLNINKESRNDGFTKLATQFQRIALMFSTGLELDEFLIHGHEHNKHVDYEIQIADAGCWIEDKSSFIKIDDGEVTCMPWPKR